MTENHGNDRRTSTQLPEARPGSRVRLRTPAAVVDKGPAAPWKLTDFVDPDTLQRLQDGFARLCRAAVSIRDGQGYRITRPSCPNRFCTLLTAKPDVEEECRLSNAASGKKAASRGRPTKYVCHAGLTQYAASIELEGHVLATVVLGDRPEERLSRDTVNRLARRFGVDEGDLWEASREIPQWSDREMQSAIEFLQLLANTITELCYQAAQLRERIEELTVLEETARMLSSGFNLDTVLNNIVKTMVQVINVKACSLRLLDDSDKELVIKATYGLSTGYLKKGPVLVARNANDQKALRGEVVKIRDMASDPNVRYPEEARREGLVSSLGIGLLAGDRPIGTLHVYTGSLHEFTDEEVRLFRAVASQATTAIENAKLLEARLAKRQLDHELELASEVQRRMLPTEAPHIPGVDVHAMALASRQVAGDFYDYIPMRKGRTGIAIADTVGKSIPAAIMTASVRSALKSQAQNIFKIGRVVGRVNRMLCEDTQPSEFVTLFYGVLNSETKRLAYCNAGHDPPMLLRNGDIRLLETGGPLLGVMEDATFTQKSIGLRPGDVLMLYTDGLIDAMNAQGRRYGRDRLAESLRHHGAADCPAKELAVALVRDVRRFAGYRLRTDDLTLVVLRVTGS